METEAKEDAAKRFLSSQDLADMLDVPLSTVRKWRVKGTGPRGFMVGKHLRFDPADVQDWLAGLERRA